MSTARILGSIVLTAGGCALGGAIIGAVGAKILSNSYDGYVVIDAVRAGAVGNSILGGIVGFGKELCSSDTEESNNTAAAENKSKCTGETVGQSVIKAGMIVLGGMLGKKILGEVCTMSVVQIATAMATGAGVLSAAGFGIGIAILCCGIGGVTISGEESQPAAPRV